MNLKISNDAKPPTEIWVGDMKAGDIGKIIHVNNSYFVGHWIMIATNDDVITLNEGKNFGIVQNQGKNFYVKLLQPGEKLTIERIN